MYRFLTAAPLAAALALTPGAHLFAQTAETDSETAQTEATGDQAAETQGSETAPAGAQKPASDIESQLSLGEDPDAPEGVGKPYTKETIGAWEMRCIKQAEDAEGEEPCQMYQLLDDGQGAPVAEFSLFRLPGSGKAEAGATVVVPLETSLPAQMTIQVDNGKPRRYPYAFCNPVGCYVRLGLTKADVASFKRGNEAVITIIPALAPDQEVKLTLSLDGFTASYDKVSVIEQ